MNKKQVRRSSLFLMELIIAILFFSVSSAVFIQFFVKSHNVSAKADILNSSLYKVTSYAELYRGSDDFFNAVEKLELPKECYEVTSDKLTVYYDGDFKECKKANKVYTLEAVFSENGRMTTGKFSMFKDNEEIYSVELTK